MKMSFPIIIKKTHLSHILQFFIKTPEGLNILCVLQRTSTQGDSGWYPVFVFVDEIRIIHQDKLQDWQKRLLLSINRIESFKDETVWLDLKLEETPLEEFEALLEMKEILKL